MNSIFLLKEVTITDPQSPYNGQIRDILIENGIIKQIAKSISNANAEIINAKGNHISPGFFDIGTQVGDPGLEQHEDFTTACKAAAAGGFTGMAVLPNSSPTTDNKSIVEYILNKNANEAVDIFPIGAITQKCKGELIAEMYDMKQAGAVAFSDGLNSLQNAGLMLRALQYVKPFDGVVLQHAEVKDLSALGVMNESETSVSLGLKGIPAVAEYLSVQRDIELCNYSNSRLHFYNATTEDSLAVIKIAKAKKINTTCGVASYYLLLNDEMLEDYNSNLKVNPPLRNKTTIEALKTAVKENTIDVICSWHQPQDIDHKNVEYDYAAYGIINLQTCFAAANTALGNLLSAEQLVEKMSINPRKILGLAVPTIKENGVVNFTVFNTTQKWKLEERMILSKSKNTPFTGYEFTGSILGIFNKKKWIANAI